MMGPKEKQWGFLHENSWIEHSEYIQMREKGKIKI